MDGSSSTDVGLGIPYFFLPPLLAMKHPPTCPSPLIELLLFYSSSQDNVTKVNLELTYSLQCFLLETMLVLD